MLELGATILAWGIIAVAGLTVLIAAVVGIPIAYRSYKEFAADQERIRKANAFPDGRPEDKYQPRKPK